MRLTVDHETTYRYDQPVRSVVQSHRLTPSVFEGQKTLEWEVTVTDGVPGGTFRDGAGDRVQGWTVAGPVSAITVSVRGTVETQDLSGVLRGHRESVPPGCYLRETSSTATDAALAALAREVTAAGGSAGDRLGLAHGLAAAVAGAIAYRPGVTHAHTTAAEALALGEGVCQDHAHALIACGRVVGIPGRYVSGYLFATADTAIILSLEAVFAVLAGRLLLGEQLTARALIGCGLMLAGILISQVMSEASDQLPVAKDE